MLSTHRSNDEFLNKAIIGPFNQIESVNIENYMKRDSSKDSIQSQECEQVYKQFKQGNIQINMYKSTQLVQQNNSENIQLKFQEQRVTNKLVNLLKVIKRKQIVERFKNNLFASAYILKNDQKQLPIFLDDNSLEKIEKGNRQVFKPKRSQFLLWICKSISTQKNFRFLKYTQENCSKILNQVFVRFKVFTRAWEIFSFLFQLFQLWYCPFIISFGHYDHTLKGIEIGFLSFILIETLFTNLSQLSQYKDSTLIDSNLKNQKQSLIYAFFQCFLWILVFLELFKISFLKEIIGLALISINFKQIHLKYVNQLEQLYLKKVNLNLLDLISLFVTIAFFIHYIACFWHYIGDSTQNLYGSWLEKEQIYQENIWMKYNYSFYWSTTTVTTVGYGDITPINKIERIFSAIVMLLSSCLFAYSINEIGIAVKSINEQKTKYKRNLILLNSYMEKQSVDQSLQQRVRNYQKYNDQKEIQDNDIETQKLLEELPSGLLNELNQDIRNKLIKKIKIFQDYFSESSNGLISKQLIQMKVTPKDTIYHLGDRFDKNLYYIMEGQVNIIEERSQKIIKVLKSGETFGEFQFFTGQNTIESAISNTSTKLFKIDRDSVLKIIQQNSKDFQRFHKIKDSIIFKGDHSLLKQSCQICKCISHHQIKCPLIQYYPNYYIKVLKSNFSRINDRSNFDRKVFKFRSLIENEEAQGLALQLQDDQSLTQGYIQSGFESQKEKISEENSFRNEDDQIFKSNLSIKKIMKHSQIMTQQNQRQSITQINSKQQMIQNQRRSIFKQNENSQINLQLECLGESYFAETLDDFDKIQNYTEYFPHNNFQFIQKYLIPKQFNLRLPQKQIKIRKGKSQSNQ